MSTLFIRTVVDDTEYFVEWSTVSDSPCSDPMTEPELRAYVLAEYGRRGVRDLDARIDRCRSAGTDREYSNLAAVLAEGRGEGRAVTEAALAKWIRRRLPGARPLGAKPPPSPPRS